MFETYKDVVTVKDIQNMLGVCKTTAYKLITSGEIQSLRVGKKFLIPKMAVIAYLYSRYIGFQAVFYQLSPRTMRSGSCAYTELCTPGI